MDKKLFKFSLAAGLVAAFLLVGCQDKNYYDPNVRPNDHKEVSTTEFSTSRTVELQLNYDVTVGFVSTFDIYTENPMSNGVLRTDLEPIAGGINVAGVSYLKRTLPVYASELYLYSSDLFVPKLMHAKVENGVASFAPVAYATAEAEPETRTIGDNPAMSSGVDEYLTQRSDYYTSSTGNNKKYDLINPVKTVNFPAEVLTAISQTFPDEKQSKSEYFQDAVIKILSDNGGNGVKVYLSLALADGQFRNSLSYFVYTNTDRDIADLTTTERNGLKITNIFQLADMHNNPAKQLNEGLTAGKAVQLKYVDNDGNYSDVFPVGAQIGFVLHSNGFGVSGGNPVVNISPKIYSIAAWNRNQAKKTIFFGARDNNENSYNFFGFEDQMSTSIDDCNDVIFNVLTDPVDAINPPPFIPEPGTIEKEASHSGILTFEDNWPKKGDYDLNDVVVKYKSTVAYVQDGETTSESGGELVGEGEVTVKRTTDVFSLTHSGAQFINGFSYKVDINPSNVEEIKITDHKGNTVDYSVISDGNGFIIDLCTNVKDVIAETSPAIYTVKMEFASKAVPENGFEELQAPYNPFITPQNTSIPSEGIEVHLPFYYPTGRVDVSLFGTNDDVSRPGQNIYYATEGGIYYPYALHLAGVSDFTVPVESSGIEVTYSKYTNWVQNGCGTTDADWYLNPDF